MAFARRFHLCWFQSSVASVQLADTVKQSLSVVLDPTYDWRFDQDR
jgi:hypothetical protein